jgi:GNAT superfamily N-acetyltransferase
VYRVEPLGSAHDRAGFACRQADLDLYLHRYAGQDARRDFARVYVLVETAEPTRILGYYTLNAAAIDIRDLPEDVRRKLPSYPAAPAILLGRLAVASNRQENGFGRFLLYDAFERSLAVRRQMGAWALVVDAIDAAAVRFYERHGFLIFPNSPRRLYLPLGRVEALLANP